MTRTVLVTGVGGFVGSHVVETLLTRTDWRVIGLDSFRHSGQFEHLVAVGGHAMSRVEAWVHDLNVPLSRRRLRELADLELDYVINVASRSHVDESISEPREFVLNNVQLALTVLELCRQVQPRRLVHVSTDEVYGPVGTGDHSHRPSSPYAASKAAQLDLVHAYALTYGVPATVITSANMFGERQMPTAYVPLVVRALMLGQTIDVHHHNGVPGERSYTYVRNVAARIVDELQDVDRDDVNPVLPIRYVELPGQRRVDNLTLALDVALAARLSLSWREVDATANRPGYDPTYATLDGDWTPEVDFADGLRQTVRWYLDQWQGRDPL